MIGQCDQIWQKLKVFGYFWKGYLLFGKILNLLWQIFHANGLIYIVLNGQILKT